MKTKSSISGFTLIEIAIVLLVVTILLGYTVAMFPVQQELKQYREANHEMNSIIDNLIAFAQVNGRLPCPDTDSDGVENFIDSVNNVDGSAGADGMPEDCTGYYAFLPSGTLGMTGRINSNGQLIDPWGTPYGYAVSNIDAGGNANAIDLVSPNGIREEGLSLVLPDLFVCSDSTALAANDKDCDDVTGTLVAGGVAVVILSLGKDPSLTPSNIQAENTDDFGDGTNDKVFIYASRNDTSGSAYDDIVKWISPNLLFSKMIEADQLP